VLAVDLDIRDVVLEDGWDVDLVHKDVNITVDAVCIVRFDKMCTSCFIFDGLVLPKREGKGRMRTSGKVPLEKTLSKDSSVNLRSACTK